MKSFVFDSNFTKVCSYGSNLPQFRIGSGNCLAANKRQAIIWTNADPVYWHIYVALGEMN